MTCVATSEASAAAARAGADGTRHGRHRMGHLAIDGADEIDARLFAIKGAGGAMLREKVVAAASDRMVVIAVIEARRCDRSREAAGRGAALRPRLRSRAAGGARRARRTAQHADRQRQPHPRRAFLRERPTPPGSPRRSTPSPGALGHGLFLTRSTPPISPPAASTRPANAATQRSRGRDSGTGASRQVFHRQLPTPGPT
ncbi:ribose-5-phosphate isomerase A [Sphingomonas sp. MMS24-JH45]